MGKTATLNIRVNPDVKENAESVLAQLGIPMATAIDMYLKQISLVLRAFWNDKVLFSWVVTGFLSMLANDKFWLQIAWLCSMKIVCGCQGRRRRIFSLDSHIQFLYHRGVIDRLREKYAGKWTRYIVISVREILYINCNNEKSGLWQRWE